jgi:CBS domain-containing membrane protein
MSKHLSTVQPDTGFKELWQQIHIHKVNAMPIVDKANKLLGIVTKEDLLKQLYPDYQEFLEDFTSGGDFEEMERRISELTAKKARDVMSTHVIFTRHETPIMRALSRMIVRGVDQLPVLNDHNEVVGVITKGDIFHGLFTQHLAKTSQTPTAQATEVMIYEAPERKSVTAVKKKKQSRAKK